MLTTPSGHFLYTTISYSKKQELITKIYQIYPVIRTVNAVVCGGILAVINDACSTLTRKPGLREESAIRLPKGSKISVSGEILKRIAEEGFWLRRTRIKLLRVFTSKILPVVVSVRLALLVTRMENACSWGGILLVIADEKLASTIIPRSSSPARMLRPRSS